MTKKMGRPTDDPKTTKITIRLGEGDVAILDEYCSANRKTRADGIRDGIRRLKQK